MVAVNGQIEFREYRDEDFDSFLQLHNAVFPPVTDEQMAAWMTREDVTAGVAVRDGWVVGEIPLHTREFMVRPGVVVSAAFQHSVCVAEEARGEGVGSRIQNAIKQFMLGRAEALTVYRGDERSPAYRFYEQNGLVDLTYHRTWRLEEAATPASHSFQAVGIEDLIARETKALAVFEDALGYVAGRQLRKPGFFADTLTNLEMCELSPTLMAFMAEESDGLGGYALVSLGDDGDGPVRILEVAARGRDANLTEALVRSVCSLAAERGAPVIVSLSDTSVCRDIYASLGFRGTPRGEMIMGMPLDWQAMADRVWWRQPDLARAGVDISTPDRDVTIRRPDGAPTRTLILEMKHHQASRYMFSRLDLQAEWSRGMLTCRNATAEDITLLGRAIPWSEWEPRDIEHI
jgi:GNAT superfamily N-acetyltransferase